MSDTYGAGYVSVWEEAARRCVTKILVLEAENENLRTLLKEGMARVHWHDCPGCKDFIKQARAALEGKE